MAATARWPHARDACVVPASRFIARFAPKENPMTTTIGPAPTPLPTIASEPPPDTPADAAAPDAAWPAEQPASDHPLVKLTQGELHVFAQALAGPQLAQAVTPGPPLELKQLEALNKKAQDFDINKAPKDEDLRRDLGTAKRHLKAATEALRNGDYEKAANHMRHLGLPLPLKHSGEPISHEGSVTAILLGAPVKNSRNGWSMPTVGWEKGGYQPLIDLNSFAANAIMIDRLRVLPGGVSNPPTEAQATQYMRDFANPAKGPKPSPQEVMKAASEITHGMIIHYSSAGHSNPSFGANPNPHASYKGADGKVHEFDSFAKAEAAARAGSPAIAKGEKIATLNATSPDAWSDIASIGKRAGRHVGDCESKVFVQTKLLTAAGFTSLGSVNVEHKDSGHMFGVFKARDGTIWITSNEEFKRVMPAVADKGVVTQEHLEYTLRNMTAEVYGVQPNYKGEFDGIKIGAAATANLKGADAAIDSIRRSTEMTMMDKTEALIPPPPAKKP
jgi:hypothetical protein